MPYYVFELNDKQKEVFFHMNDKKEYIDENGNKWTRVFVSPQANFDNLSNIDPYNEKQFTNALGKKGMTFDDMWSESSNASKKREQKDGIDHIKVKSMHEYEKKTGQRSPFRKKVKSIELDIPNKKVKTTME